MTVLDSTGTPVSALRIAVCLPSGDHVAAGFAFDLARMVGYSAYKRPDLDVRLFSVKGTLLPEVRNDLVREALRAECSHVLWLDTDMRFPKDTLLRLLAHDVPVVGCNYTTRRFPHQPTAEVAGHGLVYIERGGEGLLPVARMGLGVALVKSEVYRAYPMPWFALPWNATSQRFSGEDIFFCKQAAGAGFPPHIDLKLSVEVEHLGEMAFSNDHALAMRDIQAASETPTDGPRDDG
jgi:hypothetical protein